MNKDKVFEVAGNAGKLAVRGLAYLGTNVAILGGGLIGSMLLASKVKNTVIQTVIYSAAMGCSGIAAYLIGDMVDEHLKDEYELDVDGF